MLDSDQPQREHQNKVINAIPVMDLACSVDGSSYHGKASGSGGVFFKRDSANELKTFSIKSEGDSQQAELTAVLHALTLLPSIERNTNTLHIFCDCKSAVRYIANKCRTPTAYTDTVLKIQKEIRALRHENIQIRIYWIPGHTGNEWNERADALAKASAQLALAAQRPTSDSSSVCVCGLSGAPCTNGPHN